MNIFHLSPLVKIYSLEIFANVHKDIFTMMYIIGKENNKINMHERHPIIVFLKRMNKSYM